MTSDAKIRANRRNALRSSGPKTTAGKEQSRHNARKHGLAVPLGADDPEVQALTDAIAKMGRRLGDAGVIHSAAKDQCEVTRIQRVRADILNEQIGVMFDRQDDSVTAGERIARATAAIVTDLEALDRYERRAVSSLRKKIRKLQEE